MSDRILATARAGQELARALRTSDPVLRQLQAEVLDADLRASHPSWLDRADEYAARRGGRRWLRAGCALALILHEMALGALDAYGEP